MAGQSTAERWAPVPNFEGFYEVSDLGRIRSIDRTFVRKDGAKTLYTGRLLAPSVGTSGYLSVKFRRPAQKGQTRDIHKMVAIVFVGDAPGQTGTKGENWQVNHLNGVKSDNRAVNLEWVTKRQNQSHAYTLGLMAVGERHPCARLSEVQATEIKRRLRNGERGSVLSAEFDVSRSVVSQIGSGKAWRHLP